MRPQGLCCQPAYMHTNAWALCNGIFVPYPSCVPCMPYAAGSDAPFDGSTVNYPANAKNVIAVGAGYKWNKGDEVEVLNAYTVRGTDASGAETFTLNVSANCTCVRCMMMRGDHLPSCQCCEPTRRHCANPCVSTTTRLRLGVSATPLAQASFYGAAAFLVAGRYVLRRMAFAHRSGRRRTNSCPCCQGPCQER